MMCGGKASLDARFVDEEKVRKWKDGVKDGFVSTNDVLTSTFAMATNADILLMAINLRNRVAEADELDAGNYELVVIYDSSASNPQNIRKSLLGGPPFKRTGNGKLPGFFRTATSKCAMITNWAFPQFKADLNLYSANGEKNIPIQLHLPIYEPKNIAFPIAIIFRPCHGKLGVLYGGSPRDLTNELLMAAGAPIGDQVNKEMFPLD